MIESTGMKLREGAEYFDQVLVECELALTFANRADMLIAWKRLSERYPNITKRGGYPEEDYWDKSTIISLIGNVLDLMRVVSTTSQLEGIPFVAELESVGGSNRVTIMEAKVEGTHDSVMVRGDKKCATILHQSFQHLQQTSSPDGE